MEVAGEGDYIPIIIFSRGKIRKMPKFNFNEETVDSLLGIINIWE